jgi:transcriptional regulator with XRE-family HTH domain
MPAKTLTDAAVPMTLRRFRYLKGYETAQAFSLASEVSPPTISELENGNDSYRAAREAVCKLLKIDMKSLYRLLDISREIRRREEAETFKDKYP